jgi:hypothetical protein
MRTADDNAEFLWMATTKSIPKSNLFHRDLLDEGSLYMSSCLHIFTTLSTRPARIWLMTLPT